MSIPRLLHSHVRQVRMEEISDQTPNAGDNSEDISLPVRHILALRCLLLKVLAYLDIWDVFIISKLNIDTFFKTHNTRAWERLQRLRGHHGHQGTERSMEDNVADFGYRDLAVFIWY